MSQEPWYLYTLYKHPSDYPHQYVCRRFQVADNPIPDLHPWAVGTLQECRAAVPVGHVRICRSESDPPHIKETWI